MTLQRGYKPFDVRPILPGAATDVAAAQATAQQALEAAQGAVPAPTEPPASSPVPTLSGGIRTILGSFTAVAGATEYELHVAGVAAGAAAPTDAVDDTNLSDTTNATLFQITKGPEVTLGTSTDSTGDGTGSDGDLGSTTTTELQYGTDYYVAIVAKNNLGSAPASAWTGPVQLRQAGNAEISEDFVYAGQVTADQIQTGTMAATIALAGQFTTRGGDTTAPGVEVDPDGIRVYGQGDGTSDAPLNIYLPGDGSDAQFAGDVAARTFTSYQGASLYGDANNVKADGGLYLESGQGATSLAAPQVDQVVPSAAIVKGTVTVAGHTFALNPKYCTGWQYAPNQSLTTGGTNIFYTWQHQVLSDTAVGILWMVYLDGDTWRAESVLTDTTGYDAALVRSDGDTAAMYSWWANTHSIYTKKGEFDFTSLSDTPPAMALMPDESIRLAEVVPDGSGKIKFTNFSWAADGTITQTSSATSDVAWWGNSTPVASVVFGTFDLPSNYHVLTAATSNSVTNRVIGPLTAASEATDLEWKMPAGGVVGLDYDQGAGVWRALGLDGRLYTFTTNTWRDDTTSRWVAGVTQATASAESQVGAKTEFTWKKRWRLTVTSPQLVAPATRAGVYLWRGASGLPTDSQMVRQGYTASGGTVLAIDNPTTSGSAPGTAPTADPWPVSSPAWIRSQATDADGQPLIEINGNGQIGRDSGVLAPASGFSGSGIQLKRIGKLVFANGYVVYPYTSGQLSSFTTCVATMPAGFRPAATVTCPVCGVINSTNQYQYQITTDGLIQVRQSAAFGNYLILSTFWFVA